jgi:tRNA(fMet)-specific endonuclease VapC
MARFLVDTNHLGRAIDPDDALRHRIRTAVRVGHSFGTVVPVLFELHTGIRQMSEGDARRAARQLLNLLKTVRVWPLEREDGDSAARIFLDLRSRGRVLSQVDILLAAVALRLRAMLLTTDRDFEALPEVPAENWLG